MGGRDVVRAWSIGGGWRADGAEPWSHDVAGRDDEKAAPEEAVGVEDETEEGE